MYNCSCHYCRGYNIVTSAAADDDGKVDDEIDNVDHNKDVDDVVRYR